MKRNAKKLFVIFLVLILTGMAKLPFEQKLATELRTRRLIEKPIDLDTSIKLGQTTYAVVLGGLRSLVAAMKNLSAHTHFENQDWFELKEEYGTITTLQPRVRYYWESGSWHLAYNAYSDYADKPGIEDARRRLARKRFLADGRAMLEEGIENNPGDWRMHRALAHLLRDPFKPKDFPGAAAAYEAAIRIGNVPQQLYREYLYTLCRTPGREEDAWALARKIYENPENRGYPSIQSIYFALQNRYADPADHLTLEELFDSHKMALRNLNNYSRRAKEGFPMDGVQETLRKLVREFQLEDKYNPLVNKKWTSFPPGFYGEPVPPPEDAPDGQPEHQDPPTP